MSQVLNMLHVAHAGHNSADAVRRRELGAEMTAENDSSDSFTSDDDDD